MQNLVRNVSQRIVRSRLPVTSTIDTANCKTSRQFSSLSKTHKQVTQSHLRQIQFGCLRCSFYSTDPPNEDEPKVERTLPRLVNDKITVGPGFFSFFRITFKALKISNTLDKEFSLDDFIDGSRKAVEIVSEKLASGDFDGLRGLVKDDIIDNLRDTINSWTEEQRSELRVALDDICRIYVSEIDINEEDDGAIVDISMIYHVVKGFKELTNESNLKPGEFITKSSKFLDDNFFILNYKFTKKFSKDSNDDWIVSYINHVNIADEMQEQTKGIEELMKKGWKNFEKEQKKKK